MESKVSERLVDQRIRNRIMEALWIRSLGVESVDAALGAKEWFESFFDWLPYQGPTPRDNTAITPGEYAAVDGVLAIMQRAYSETPIGFTRRGKFTPTDEQLLASGWPERVAPVAKAALEMFCKRGRFSEDVEEDSPSSLQRWPGCP
jgi:hypothetical protein